MLIKDIKDVLIRAMAKEEQMLQGNIPDEDKKVSEDSRQGNFDWDATIQGRNFWANINRGNFTKAYDILNLTVINGLKE